MSYNLEAAATKIIKDSIISSVYIDDKIVEPFEAQTDANKAEFNISKGLFSSFRKENKSIDYYKFSLANDWKTDIEYILKNRDLLVLDWQLDDNKGLKQTDTLAILNAAVNTDNLHFVSIYTTENRLDEILYSIKAYFDKNYDSNSLEKYEAIIKELDDNGADTSFFKEYAGKFKDIAIGHSSKRQTTIEELKTSIKEALGDNYKFFARGLKNLSSEVQNSCEIIGYILNGEAHNEQNIKTIEVNSDYSGDKFIVINHTIIQINNKKDPDPNELFQLFTKVLQKICGNPLTLMGLEIKHLLRESSGFIGKDADSINDAALFFHKSKSEEFFSFILGIWKSHSLSLVNHKVYSLEAFKDEFWDGYKKELNIDNKLTDLRADDNKFHHALAKLNVYYNILHILKQDGEAIRFGDVFVGMDENNKPDGKYYLCITAHCDCLRPETNIKNNFYFVSGEHSKIKDTLQDGDDGFYSYLPKSVSETTTIKWNSRPIILKIDNNKLVNSLITAKDGRDKEYSLKYHTTLKESYAQRMANNSFAFAMRVGIDFVSIK